MLRVWQKVATGLIALVALGSPKAFADPEPLGFEVTAGYGGSATASGWMPVEVTIHNPGPDLRAVLQIQNADSWFQGASVQAVLEQAPEPPGPAGHELQVSLPSGSTKSYRLFLPASGLPRIRLFSTRGRLLASKTARVSPGAPSSYLAVLSDDPTMLSGLGLQIAGPATAARLTIHLDAATLPDSTSYLEDFPLIAIDDFNSSSLTARQRSALSDYVESGGLLLIGTGGSWHKTIGGLPEGLLPMKPDGTQSFDQLPKLSSALGAGPVGASIELATGSQAGGRTILSEGTTPVLVEAVHGSGRVILSTLDFGTEPARSWKGTAGILSAAMARFGMGGQEVPAGGRANTSARANRLAGDGGALSSGLSAGAPLKLPSKALVLGFLALYFLLVGPINYLVMRRARRQDLSWITIPAIIAAFTVTACAAGTQNRHSQPAIRIRLHHINADGKRSEVVTGTGIPSSGPFAFVPSQPGVPTAGLTLGLNASSVFDAPAPPTVEGGLRERVRLSLDPTHPVAAFSQAAFENLPGSLDQKLVNEGGRIKGTITNHLAFPIDHGEVVIGPAVTKFGIISPGESITIDAPPPFPQPSNARFNPLTPPDTDGRASDFGSRARDAVLITLPQAGPSGNGFFIAWTSGTSSIQVNGRARPTRDLDAWMLDLKPVPTGSFSNLRPDAIGGSGASDGTGPPQMMQIPAGGTETYEFYLPQSRFATLTLAVTLRSAFQRPHFVAPVPQVSGSGPAAAPAIRPVPAPPPPVQAQGAKVEVFDPSSSSWVPLDAPTGLPAFMARVDPSFLSSQQTLLMRATPVGAPATVDLTLDGIEAR